MTPGQKVLRLFQTRPVRTGILVLTLLFTIGIVRSVITIAQKRGIVAERQQVLRQEEAKRNELLERLKEATSASFIERAAREKLGLVKEGETVVILDKTKLLNQDTPVPAGPVSNWKQWWNLFF